MSDPAVIALLTDIRDELRALNAAMAPGRLSHRDHVLLGQLLPAIVDRLGCQTLFTVRDLLQNPDLQVLVSNLDARSIGVMLSRAAGHDIGGLRLFKIESRDHGAAVWGIQGR